MKNYQIVLENTKDELVVIVDRNNNVTGSSTRKEMRRNNLPHRCTAIIIFNREKEKFLIQKRSLQKEFCPGYLDIVIGGVVGSGEENSENESAVRELNEEIGLNINELNTKYPDLELHLKFLGTKFFQHDITITWSYVFLFIIPSFLESQIKFSDGEVESIQWLTQDEILEKIEKNEKITPDSIDTFIFYLENLKKI